MLNMIKHLFSPTNSPFTFMLYLFECQYEILLDYQRIFLKNQKSILWLNYSVYLFIKSCYLNKNLLPSGHLTLIGLIIFCLATKKINKILVKVVLKLI